jgi:trehalose 6-phosphate phosphatase
VAPPELTEALAPFVADPAGSVLLFDFDGTLSPIVDDPAAARPSPGVVDLLGRLAARYRIVGAVSGRSVDFLAAHLPPALALSGLYGLETAVDGRGVLRPGVEHWEPVVADAAARAAGATVPGMLVEHKRLSVTLHYRSHPEAGPAVLAAADDLAAATGLEARSAKMSVELHPPVASDKGEVVRELADGARGVLYVGDDVGDLPAFHALADLRTQGLTTVGIAIGTPELPTALRSAADVVVDGPPGAVDVLRALAG